MRHVQQILIDRDEGIVKIVLAGDGEFYIGHFEQEVTDLVNGLGACKLANNFTIEHTETTK